jgi:hypothetical protein
MSAKEQATLDIMADLEKSNKSFIAFRRELNSTMRKLVSRQIKQQKEITNLFSSPSHSHTQLMARCFFAKGEVRLENYTKYYK